jgi:type II secretory ATPase GspE/PulE/Tfp pilus assembly ATPase PilB-like protein
MFTFGTKQFPSIPATGPGLFPLAERATKTPLEMLCEFNACIIGEHEGATLVAAVNPTDSALRFFVQQHVSETITWYVATPAEITHVMRLAKLDYCEKIESLLHSTSIDESSISRIVSYTIQYAFSELASDIHFEPKKYHASVRFRVDGVLHKMFEIPSERYSAIVARIKILANLRTDESRRPQDGRIEPEGYDGASLRVSVMPTLYGEKIVMRVLDETSAVLEQSSLGFNDAQIKIIKQNIEKPYGMIIASGPTGSGKTTTLYSLLNLLSTDTVNIATLEDPIEYALEGVNQTQVNPELDFSFARGLRTLLRQDPDVILVGEVRDHETTAMAAQASMTGHLVLTSMHTNDAPSAFPRFIEMGIEEFMVVSTINLVIAQRLVRKLCPKCSKKETLPDIIKDKITQRKDVCATLESVAPGSIDHLAKTKYAQPVGCDDCLGSGYSGRIGIFELLEMTPEIHDAVLSGKSAAAIREVATKNGFSSMLTDGIQKVLDGQTTFAEVLRTTRTN